MKRSRIKFGIIIVLLVFLMLSGPSLFRKVASQAGSQKRNMNTSTIKITNKARSIDSIKLEAVGNRLIQVNFKNQYNKAITALQLSFGSVVVTDEFIYDESQYISPGETFSKVFPIQPDMETEGFAILAIVFEDETSEGEPLYAQEVMDCRRGKQAQYARFLSKLKEIENLPENQLGTALSALKGEVSNSPSENITNLSAAYQSRAYYLGLRSGAEDVLKDIERLDSGQHSGGVIRDMVKAVKTHYQKLSNRMVSGVARGRNSK